MHSFASHLTTSDVRHQNLDTRLKGILSNSQSPVQKWVGLARKMQVTQSLLDSSPFSATSVTPAISQPLILRSECDVGIGCEPSIFLPRLQDDDKEEQNEQKGGARLLPGFEGGTTPPGAPTFATGSDMSASLTQEVCSAAILPCPAKLGRTCHGTPQVVVVGCADAAHGNRERWLLCTAGACVCVFQTADRFCKGEARHGGGPILLRGLPSSGARPPSFHKILATVPQNPFSSSHHLPPSFCAHARRRPTP